MNDFLSQLGIAGMQGWSGGAPIQTAAEDQAYRYPPPFSVLALQALQMLNSCSAKPPFQQRREKAVEYAMEVRKRKGWIPCKT